MYYDYESNCPGAKKQLDAREQDLLDAFVKDLMLEEEQCRRDAGSQVITPRPRPAPADSESDGSDAEPEIVVTRLNRVSADYSPDDSAALPGEAADAYIEGRHACKDTLVMYVLFNVF